MHLVVLSLGCNLRVCCAPILLFRVLEGARDSVALEVAAMPKSAAVDLHALLDAVQVERESSTHLALLVTSESQLSCLGEV